MDYRSSITNVVKFYRTASSVAISAAWFPMILLAPLPVVAGQELQPSIEVNFEALDNIVEGASDPFAPKLRTTLDAKQKSDKKPISAQGTEKKPLVYVDPNPEQILRLPLTPQDGQAQVKPEIVKKSEQVKKEIKKQSATESKPKDIKSEKPKKTTKEVKKEPKVVESKKEAKIKPQPVKKSNDSSVIDKKTNDGATKVKELISPAPLVVKPIPIPVPVPSAPPAPVEKLPELPTPPAKELKVETPKIEPVPAAPPAPVEKLPELPTPPAKELKVETPKIEPVPAAPPAPVEKLPELPTPPAKELKVETPKIEPVPAAPPAPVEKLPEIPTPPAKELKVETPKIEPVPSAPPAPVEKLPELPTPPAKELKVEAPKTEPVPAAPPAPVEKLPELPTPPAKELKVETPKALPTIAPEIKPEEPSAVPVDNTQVKDLSVVKAKPEVSSAGTKVDYSITFISTETDLPLSVAEELKAMANKIKSADQRVVLKAYASESADQSTTARRVSLSRVLAVRAFLIENGVDKMSINVQAEGSKNPGGEPDRVDFFIGDKK